MCLKVGGEQVDRQTSRGACAIASTCIYGLCQSRSQPFAAQGTGFSGSKAEPACLVPLIIVQAQAGDVVQVRVGGAFHYQPGDEARPLLLLAGGIGITPLHSILRHCVQLAAVGSATGGEQQQPQQQGRQQQQKQHLGEMNQSPPLRATVLFSASAPEELALLKDLRQLVESHQAAPGKSP